MNNNLLLLAAATFSTFLLGAATALGDTPPQIIDPPLTQFAWVGRPVTFKVSFTNKSAMAFQWQWNGDNLPNATNRTLRLNGVALTNGGDYRVLLSNSAGVTASAVARLTVRDWPPPTGVSFTHMSRLETNLQTLMCTHVVPGLSLAVMKEGRLILARGFGYADPGNSEEQVQPDSLFRIASLSKAITATAVLKLVDDGRLNLDDRAFPLINLPPPDFTGATMDPRLTNITVRQLLHHTAGWSRETAKNPLGQVGGFEPFGWPQRCAADLGITNRATARDLMQWIMGFPLQTKPGIAFDYSNNGYLAAGLLVEQLAGVPYEEAIRSLLAPADITRLRIVGRTYAERRPDEVVPIMNPLIDVRGGTSAELPSAITGDMPYFWPADWTGGAGAWMTSPIDYARFITTIDGQPALPDLLTTNALKTMLTPSQASLSGFPYGMGWGINSASGEIFHGGFYSSGAGALTVRRRDGVVFVVFCNTFDVQLQDALWTTLDSGVSANRTWPTNDLFAATMSYEAWQARHFTLAERSQLEMAGDDADPDGDDLSNLVEYAQNSDPRVADHQPWLRGRILDDGGQAGLALVYRRRPLGHAVAYDLEVSGDLKTWESFGATTAETLDPDGMLTTTLTETAIDPNAGARFVRVKVRRAHPEP